MRRSAVGDGVFSAVIAGAEVELRDGAVAAVASVFDEQGVTREV
jgi:hypothetical protein